MSIIARLINSSQEAHSALSFADRMHNEILYKDIIAAA